MQNNGKERQKACCTCKFVFLLIRKKIVLHVQFVFTVILALIIIIIIIETYLYKIAASVLRKKLLSMQVL